MGFTGVVRNAVSDHRCKACTIFSPTEGAVDSAMTTQWLAGADGCRAGWIVAFVGPNHNIRVRILSRFLEIFAALEQPRLIAIDVPIGLPAQIGPQGRGPERAVRPLLGARQSSVFAVPSRPAIYANDYGGACRLALDTSAPPKKVSRQLFMIAAKIREVDQALRDDPTLTDRVFEIHPEVAFLAAQWRPGANRTQEGQRATLRPGARVATYAASRPRISADFDRRSPATRRSRRRSSRCAGLRGDRATHPSGRRDTVSGSTAAVSVRVADGDLGVKPHAALCFALISSRLIRHSAI